MQLNSPPLGCDWTRFQQTEHGGSDGMQLPRRDQKRPCSLLLALSWVPHGGDSKLPRSLLTEAASMERPYGKEQSGPSSKWILSPRQALR